MNNFEKPPQPEQKPEFCILSERDQKVLKNSAKNVAEMLLSDFPQELPDAIIFPETTARPLVYIFGPILERAAEQRGVKKPKLVFFQLEQGFFESDRLGAKRGIDKRGIKEETESFLEFASDNMKQWYLEDMQAVYKNYLLLKEANKKRAEEIDNNGKKSLAIVDDFVGEGRAVEEIRNIFNKKIPAYALLASNPESAKTKEIKFGGIESYLDKNHPNVFDYEMELKNAIGVVKSSNPADIYVQTSKKRNEEIEKKIMEIGKEKFSYVAAVSPEKLISQEINPEAMKNLRKDMKLIGEKIASELEIKKNE